MRDDVRESAMTLTCHNCKKPGHKMRLQTVKKKSDKSSNVKSGNRKWWSYHHNNGHLNKNCYQQQSESANLYIKIILCTHHKSGSHSDDECYHQRNCSRSSTAKSKSTKYETFIANSTVTDSDKFSCKSRVQNKCTDNDDESNMPPGIGFSFAMCHLPLSQGIDAFQLLADSRSSKHFIGPELIRGVKLRMLEYTTIEPPMEIRAAGDSVLRGTAQGILLVVVRGIDDVLWAVKLSIVLVPGLKRNPFSSLAVAQKASKQPLKKLAHPSTLDRSVFS